jgi:hypothetical protein
MTKRVSKKPAKTGLKKVAAVLRQSPGALAERAEKARSRTSGDPVPEPEIVSALRR